MTLPVMQFCFAVASGDSEGVRRLFPLLSDQELFQENNYGVSPALFCFLAFNYARELKDEILLKKLIDISLSEKYSIDDLSHHAVDKPNSENVVAASVTAIEIIKEKLGKNLTTFLSTMLPHLSDDFEGDIHTQLTLKSCMHALKEALKDNTLSEVKRAGTQTFLDRLSGLYLAPITNQSPLPNSLKVMQQEKLYLNLYPTKSHCAVEARLDQGMMELRETISSPKIGPAA